MKQPKVGDRKVLLIEFGRSVNFISNELHFSKCELGDGIPCQYLECKPNEAIDAGALIAAECTYTGAHRICWRRISDD